VGVSLPRYIVVLFGKSGGEVIWPEKYQFKEGYETRKEYQRWFWRFMERYVLVAMLFNSPLEQLTIHLARLKEGGSDGL